MNAKQAKAARKLSRVWEAGELVVDRKKYRALKRLLKITGVKLKTAGYKKRHAL